MGTQLAWRLRAAIDRGELAPGERLPSLRDAAAAAGVNVNTVRAVYAKLEAAGVVATEQGRGTFVAERRADGAADARRRLRDEIAALEAELVSLPPLPSSPSASGGRGGAGARLLSVDELATVRDVLAAHVAELRSAREEIVGRLESRRAGADSSEDAAANAGEPARSAEPPARAPARRSSSSLAGARVRWTG